MLKVGKILRPHGVKGEVKTESYLDSPDLLARTKTVFIGGTKYTVEFGRVSGGFCLLKLSGISDMNGAESLRNLELSAEKSDLPPLSVGRFYISDLLGCKVFVSDTYIGKLTDILQNGAKDVYTVENESGKTVYFPLADGVITDINIAEKRITADRNRFDEVAVYED